MPCRFSYWNYSLCWELCARKGGYLGEWWRSFLNLLSPSHRLHMQLYACVPALLVICCPDNTLVSWVVSSIWWCHEPSLFACSDQLAGFWFCEVWAAFIASLSGVIEILWVCHGFREYTSYLGWEFSLCRRLLTLSRPNFLMHFTMPQKNHFIK